MAVNLADPIPDWTDGTDHWRDQDVTWLVDRIVLRLPDRTTVTAGSGNAGKVIYSIADAAPYISVASAWKAILASSKIVLTDGTDPELRLSAQAAGSGIVFKSASTIAVNTLQVSGGATISGALQTASTAVTGNATVGGTLAVTGNTTLSGTLVTGAITTPSISGNAATATKLATARNISIVQEVSGTVAFDGSNNVSIFATVNNKSSASAANTLVMRDVNHAFSASGTCNFNNLNLAGTLTVAQINLGNGSLALNGSITGNSSINCFQLTAAGSLFAQFITTTGGIMTARRSSGIGASWDTVNLVLDGNGSGAAGISFYPGGPQAAQIRMGTAVNDLYFVNSNNSVFITLNAGFFNVASSARYKTDIKPLDIDALDVVRQLAPVSWYSNDLTDKKMHIGFTAEALDEIFPDAVVRDEQGRPDVLNTYAIDTLSLVAAQQLLSRIEAIEARLA